jgi:hypothetical protein
VTKHLAIKLILVRRRLLWQLLWLEALGCAAVGGSAGPLFGRHG